MEKAVKIITEVERLSSWLLDCHSRHWGMQQSNNQHRSVNTLWLRWNRRHFADKTSKHIFLNENNRIANKISLKFVLKGPISNIPSLVQIMAWRRLGDKPLSEPMMVRSLTQMHVCVKGCHFGSLQYFQQWSINKCYTLFLTIMILTVFNGSNYDKSKFLSQWYK